MSLSWLGLPLPSLLAREGLSGVRALTYTVYPPYMLSLGYGLSWGLFPQAGVPPRRLYRTLAPPFPRGPPGQGAWRFAQGLSFGCIRLFCRAACALDDFVDHGDWFYNSGPPTCTSSLRPWTRVAGL